jgi:foldase protein PrsA
MKKVMKKMTALLLLCATLLVLASSCSGVDTSYAVRYGSGEVSKALFQYLCSMEKTTYLYELWKVDSSTYSAGQLQDNPAFWSAATADGTTLADDLKLRVLQKVQIYLYMQQHAKNQGYSLSADQKKTIEQEFNKNILSFGTKGAFNEYMAQYGVNYDQIILYNELQSLAYQGNELLFGETGSMRISEDSAKRYFDKNYITVSCIYINTKNKTYPNGKNVILPPEEMEEKINLAKNLLARAQSGEDFTALVKEYSDLTSADAMAEKGYTFEKGGFVNPDAEARAFTMNTGEIVSVETDKGVYIIRRDALDQTYFSTEKESIRTTLEEAKKLSLILDAKDSFEMDEEFMNGLDIANLPHLV